MRYRQCLRCTGKCGRQRISGWLVNISRSVVIRDLEICHQLGKRISHLNCFGAELGGITRGNEAFRPIRGCRMSRAEKAFNKRQSTGASKSATIASDSVIQARAESLVLDHAVVDGRLQSLRISIGTNR